MYCYVLSIFIYFIIVHDSFLGSVMHVEKRKIIIIIIIIIISTNASQFFYQRRLYHRTHRSRQEVSACLRHKWDLMPFVCLTPSGRRSVPVWMCLALEDVTGDFWHAVWALTGPVCLRTVSF